MYRSDKHFMKNPATASSRIYIGNIADPVLAPDLEDKFKPHGKILGLVLQRGFAFIQFENESQAHSAICSEHSSLFFGRKLNVKQAVDKTRGNTPLQPTSTIPPPSPQHVSQPVALQAPSPVPLLLQKHFSPPKDAPLTKPEEMDTITQDDFKGNLQNKQMQNNFDLPSHPIDDLAENRKRGGGGDGQRGGGGGQRGGGGGGRRGGGVAIGWNQRERHHENERLSIDDFNTREIPPRDQPIRDAPPYYGREDGFRPGFVPPTVIDRPERNDCEIIVVSKLLTEYAEYIEKRLKSIGLIVDLLFPNEDVPLGRVLANISSRGCLYAILVMPQNEECRSLTLSVLHGIAQEHRNMPVDDAILLISRNFDAYMRGEKSDPSITGSGTGSLTERHPEAVQMLFNLLAENRQITTVQYDRLLKYLEERRKLQRQFEISEGNANAESEGEPTSKQAELQSRIMNILNKSADEVPKPPEIQTHQSSSGPTPLLKDPSVQKALDSLLLGDMFKTMSSN